MKTVLFYDPNLNERGTSVAVYDYAHYNETILGNKSIIATTQNSDLSSFDKFNNRFEVIITQNIQEIYNIKCDYFHVLKYGFNDGVLHPDSKNLVHVVFPSYDKHGDVYAYVSEWLANNHGNNSPFVPHMIDLPNIKEDFRNQLELKDKLVVGYYGGNNFEIDFARQAVIDIAKKRKDIEFLFMNQDSFSDLDNIRFFSKTVDIEQKVAFINTCDIMIHARERGEAFGLAIGEFSSKNKPIITYRNSPEKNHIEILGEKGIYYDDYKSLYNILENIDLIDINGKEWNCYQDYTPEKVINKFNDVFL